MKIVPFVFCLSLLATACEQASKPAETTLTLKSDTTFVVKPELPIQETEIATPAQPEQKAAVVSKKKASSTKKSVETTQPSASTSNATTAEGAGTTAAAQDNGTGQTASAEPEKKGWSKTAKGAVIGGVVGAGAGAVINGKNRAAGAVIGGVVGAGAGAVIGNAMDKKDGRH